MGGDGALSLHNGDDDDTNNTMDKADITKIETTLKGLSYGLLRPTTTHDSAGRALLFIDPSRLANYNKHNDDERFGVARALWYVLHSMLEGNETAQKVGIVVVGYPHHAKLSYLDRKLMKMNVESLSGCIPVRLGGFHICHLPWFFGKVAFPLMKLVMPERMRKRVRVHVGSEEKVLKELEEVGMGREVLPSEIGGDVVLDNDGWMQERKMAGL